MNGLPAVCLACLAFALLAASPSSATPLVLEPQGSLDYAHRAVLINAQMEAQLPEQLKNPFYRNPRIAQALAKESWFGPGESPVAVREAEKIPRERIFSVLKNAGLARR